MRIFIWLLRLAVFLFFLALAARNVQPVTLTFLSEYRMEAPLVVLLLGAFLLGVILTAVSLLLTVLRQRREILHLGAELHAAQEAGRQSQTESLNPLLPPIA